MADIISKSSILETVDAAIEYSSKLERNLTSVLQAELQVNDTAEESLKEIDRTFDELTKSVLDAINNRRDLLKERVRKIQEEGLEPLKACKDVIKQTLKTTQSYICEGQALLDRCDNVCVNDVDQYVKYFDQSSHLGNLPAVPSMEEVPCITFQLNKKALQTRLVQRVLEAGVVYKIGPVQITSVTEKPGALQVHWDEVEDRGMDEPYFRLQLASGSHPSPRPQHSTAIYRDVFEGGETSCVIRDLRAGTLYTLRVTVRDNHGDWCAWSLPRVAISNLPHFSWSSISPHYSTSVEGKIAAKIDKTKAVLLSNARHFGPDHSLEFKILECPENRQPSDGVGLVDTLDMPDTLVQRGCLFLAANGSIYVDGGEKTTRLPPLVKGSCVVFTCEPLSSGRVRVHIERGDKAVTYDWRVSSLSLHFASACSHPGWKLMVE